MNDGGSVRKSIFLAGLMVCLFLGLMNTGRAQAQTPSTYTVQPGDTLGVIATQLGVTLEDLAAANGITDVNLISAGQVLVVPGPGSLLPMAAAYPGDSLADMALRLGTTVEQMAALNQMDGAARLFPGQPVQIPPGAAGDGALRFGAVTGVGLPDQIVQGRTGRLAVQSSRPLSLTATWNGLPLHFQPNAARSEVHGQSAFLPTPALLGPGSFPVEIGYETSSGAVLSQTFSVLVTAGPYETQLLEMSQETIGLLDPQFTQPEIEKLYALWAVADAPLGWTEPFSRPIGLEYPTTSPYGTRRSYNGGPYSYHAGQDFGAPAGITVTAPGNGIVVLAEPLNVRGNAVVIDHGAGVFTGFWHLSEIIVTPGQQVAVGDALGLVGTTGLSTGNHLHWELRIYGVSVDPMQFLEEGIGE